MFEFEQTDYALAPRLSASRDAEAASEYGRERIASYSIASWGEHCTECAFPSCYTTCSFYSPRQDGRCRRFTFGILRTPSPSSWMGYAAFVEFKNWSMFWTQGNATQLPNGVSALVQSAGTLAWALSSPIDALLQRTTGRKRLSVALQSLRRRTIKRIGSLYNRFPKPDAFLLDIVNPMSTSTGLRLWIRGGDTAHPSRFEWSASLGPGRSSFVIPVADIERSIDLARPFDMGLTINDDQRSLYVCSATFVRLVPQPVAAPAVRSGARKVKCLVWDLDGTLWDGILLESDSTPRLKDGIRRLLQELDRRGILLSIASKNAEEDARRALESLGVWDLFLVPQIGWQPKSQSLARIAAQLNIGVDAVAMIDDTPFERDEIRAVIPGVTVIAAEDYLSVLERPEFAGDASGEGSARRQMYRTEMTRQQAMAESHVSFDAFLASCDIRVSIERPGHDLLPRINDIVQRTNQLNISTARYTVEELRRMIDGRDCDCYVVSCEDRYGAYGHVGFIVVTRTASEMLLRDCMFSCRIQGKRIDEAVVAYIINSYLAQGISVVQARFISTPRNAPAGEMLRRLGFAGGASADGVLSLSPATPRDTVDYVHIDGKLETHACVLS